MLLRGRPRLENGEAKHVLPSYLSVLVAKRKSDSAAGQLAAIDTLHAELAMESVQETKKVIGDEAVLAGKKLCDE